MSWPISNGMNEKNIIINISSGTFLRAILLGLLFVLLYILRDLVLVLLTSVVIASAIEPATRWFAKYRVPRIPAVIFVYVFIVAFIVMVLYLFIPPFLNEFSSLSSSLPQYLESINLINPITGSGAEGLVGDLSKTFPLGETIKNIQGTIVGFSNNIFQTLSAVFGGVFSFILIIIISFYLAVQERGIENFLQIIVPDKHEKYIIDLWKRSQAKIGKWMQGQLLLGLLIGVLVYLGLTILGVKYAFTLAIFAAMAELIPIFGPIIAAVPAVLLGFLDGPTLGFMVIGLYVIIQQFENHLIYPLVVRKVVGVPPLLVILALIIGGQLAGFLGILLSAPIAAVIIEFTNDIQREKQKLSNHEK